MPAILPSYNLLTFTLTLYISYVLCKHQHDNSPSKMNAVTLISYRVGDRAIALCRTPKLTLYVFSLPKCDLQVCPITPPLISRTPHFSSLILFLLAQWSVLPQVVLPLFREPGLAEIDSSELDQRYLVTLTTKPTNINSKRFVNHPKSFGKNHLSPNVQCTS